ncbi:MAG TPA: CDGSH iron-sulfur domain-containing protein [Anaeromyxobacteraceae bacterium]|jgi:CDGSH-type Zn-finger protein
MPKITCLPNGPYLVEDVAEIADGAGKQFDTGGRAKVALCRCGNSKNKPFCDGTHKAGFKADDTAPRK